MKYDAGFTDLCQQTLTLADDVHNFMNTLPIGYILCLKVQYSLLPIPSIIEILCAFLCAFVYLWSVCLLVLCRGQYTCGQSVCLCSVCLPVVTSTTVAITTVGENNRHVIDSRCRRPRGAPNVWRVALA